MRALTAVVEMEFTIGACGGLFLMTAVQGPKQLSDQPPAQRSAGSSFYNMMHASFYIRENVATRS